MPSARLTTAVTVASTTRPPDRLTKIRSPALNCRSSGFFGLARERIRSAPVNARINPIFASDERSDVGPEQFTAAPYWPHSHQQKKTPIAWGLCLFSRKCLRQAPAAPGLMERFGT